MLNGSMNKGMIIPRSGGSFARGMTVDLVLEADDAKALYEKWDNAWGEPLGFSGGEKAITCEMVLAAPLQKFSTALGSKRAGRILEAARKFAQV